MRYSFRLQAVLVVVLLLQLAYCAQSVQKIMIALSARERVARYELELEKYRAEYEQNQARLRYVRSDRFVEDVIRTDLGWTLEGETVFIVSENAIGPSD